MKLTLPRLAVQILLCVFLSFGLIITGCQSKVPGAKQVDKMIRVVIFPTGMSTDTYVVELDHHGNMVTRYGQQKNQEYNSVDFLLAKETKDRQLNTNQMERVESLIAAVGKLDEQRKTTIHKGGWEAMIIIGGKYHHIDLEEIRQYPKAIQELIDDILEVTPLKIELKSWS